MTLVKWKRPFENGHKNDQLFNNSPLSELLDDFFRDHLLTKEYAQFVPAVNISEEKSNYLVEVSAPGFEKNDFKIELNEGMLTVSAKHRTENEVEGKKFSRKEFNYGSFQRSLSVPEEINEENIEAKYNNGILKVILPKKEEAKNTSKEIKIS